MSYFDLIKKYQCFWFCWKGVSFSIKLGAVKRKMSSCCYFTTTIAKWIQVILKVVLNLCSHKQLKPCHLILYLMPLGLWQLNRLLCDSLTNYGKEVELRISISHLFHSRITETTKSETKFNEFGWVYLTQLRFWIEIINNNLSI